MGIPSNLGATSLSQTSDSESESGYNSSSSSRSGYSSDSSISSVESEYGTNPPISREEADRLYEEAMELEYEKREGGA